MLPRVCRLGWEPRYKYYNGIDYGIDYDPGNYYFIIESKGKVHTQRALMKKTFSLQRNKMESYNIWSEPELTGSARSNLTFRVLKSIPSSKVVESTENQVDSSLLNTFQQLCMNEKLSDVKLVCDGQEFPCHKFMLSARSQVFQAMFSSDLEENASEMINIEDFDVDTIKSFLKYLYTDKFEDDSVNCELLRIADKYDVKGLVQSCVNHIEKKMTLENILEVIYNAFLIDNKELLKASTEFILENRGQIQRDSQWDEIQKNNPEIGMKIMNLIMFGN